MILLDPTITRLHTEAPMWKLIIFLIAFSGSSDGGTHTSTTVVAFDGIRQNGQELCLLAKKQIEEDWSKSSGGFTVKKLYIVRAECVQTR